MKDTERKRIILLVCTGNTCRSPLAQVIISDYLSKSSFGANFTVLSAGVSVPSDVPASEYAIQVADELGLDLKGHIARQISQTILDGSDLILCMTKAHKFCLLHDFEKLPGKCFTLAECAASKDISDPYGQNVGAYRKIANDIKDLMPRLLNFLVKFFPDEGKERKNV